MPTPTKGHRLGGSPAHERHILANLATALFQHGRITTTEAKAKRLRPVAERLITFAKRGDLHARRHVLTVVTDKGVVHQLFTEIAPEFSERDGGYTRITKIGPRKGDNAAMAVIELVRGEPVAAKPRRRARRTEPKAAVPAATAAAAEEVTDAEATETAEAPGATETAEAPGATETGGAPAAAAATGAEADAEDDANPEDDSDDVSDVEDEDVSDVDDEAAAGDDAEAGGEDGKPARDA
jgi:large subunit ribosomal protein L17